MTRLRALLLAVLLLAGCSGKPADGGAGADWPGHGGAADESGFSRLAEIDRSNIGRLGLAWSLDLPGEATLEATPLAVDGVLYFTGSYSAAYAVDGASGKLLWRFNAGHGIVAAPMSFEAGGKQYVAVLAGYGGAWGEVVNAGWKYGAQPRRLLAFALDAKAVLARGLPPDSTVRPLDDPAIRISDADVAAGRQHYLRCVNCHGLDLAAGGVAPDLRESPLAMDVDRLWPVLHDGTLRERGMPRYDKLTREQVRQIYAYIRAGAREAVKSGAADGAGR